MRMWRLNEPRSSTCACFTVKGTWHQVEQREGICKECTSAPLVDLRPPFIIEWLPYGDQLADFVWSQGGCGEPLVLAEVGRALRNYHAGANLVEVRMVQDPKLKRPARVTKRTKSRIWLPYDGPPLVYLHTTKWVHLDATRSTGRFDIDCKTCGRRRFKPEGVEHHVMEWDHSLQTTVPVDQPRRRGHGLCARAKDLQKAEVFGVHEVSHLTFCTDRFREFILAQGYSNITFWEYGDII